MCSKQAVDSLQVIVTAGPEDAHRATLAFALAVAAQANGTDVTVFLTMDATRWLLPSGGDIRPVVGFESVDKYIEAFLASGGRLEACSTCVTHQCSVSDRESDVRYDMSIVGLTEMASRMLEMQTVTF